MVLLSVVGVLPCVPPFGGDFLAIFERGMTNTIKTMDRSSHPCRRPTQRAANTEIATERYNHGSSRFNNATLQIHDTAIRAMISLLFVFGRDGALDRRFTRTLSTSLRKDCRAELLSRSTVYFGGLAIPCSFDSSSPTQIVFWLLTGMRETD